MSMNKTVATNENQIIRFLTREQKKKIRRSLMNFYLNNVTSDKEEALDLVDNLMNQRVRDLYGIISDSVLKKVLN